MESNTEHEMRVRAEEFDRLCRRYAQEIESTLERILRGAAVKQTQLEMERRRRDEQTD